MADSLLQRRRSAILASCAAAILMVAGLYYVRDASRSAAPAGPQPVTVVAVAAVRGPITIEFEGVGSLRANEAVTVTTKVPGIVRDISFHETDEVRAGQPLLQLDTAEARANLAVAEAARRNASQLLERAKTLIATQAVSRSRVDELQAQLDSSTAQVRAAEARLRDLTIVAPFAGKTGLRRVSLGALIAPGTEITTLDDIAVMRLDFTLPDTFLSAVTPGQTVKAFASDAADAQPIVGTVHAVGTRLSTGARQAMVSANLPNQDRMLRPGMFLRVRLELGRRDDVVLIPEEALVTSSGSQFVYVVADGRATRRAVTIGANTGGTAEVRRGLAPGELVVTRGTIKLRDGLPVRLQPQAGEPMAANQKSTS